MNYKSRRFWRKTKKSRSERHKIMTQAQKMQPTEAIKSALNTLFGFEVLEQLTKDEFLPIQKRVFDSFVFRVSEDFGGSRAARIGPRAAHKGEAVRLY